LHGLGRAISLSSFLRKQESRLLLTAFWIPACAGMTDQHLSEKPNLDKTVSDIYNKIHCIKDIKPAGKGPLLKSSIFRSIIRLLAHPVGELSNGEFLNQDQK
jgi:hypothetical protein